jgi:hypothetical protein
MLFKETEVALSFIGVFHWSSDEPYFLIINFRTILDPLLNGVFPSPFPTNCFVRFSSPPHVYIPHPAYPSSLVIVPTFGEEDRLFSRNYFTYVFLASISELPFKGYVGFSKTEFVSPSTKHDGLS